ncbi:MAG: glycosyltransferase family 39 protein [Chloroflexota bacterium]|nr:glycosyltransferase family 39 protein [Dehalococcoidia bacterium]MDW8253445.1 glycosyltransferase family 39 protein [Chloroflexota bacterium]
MQSKAIPVPWGGVTPSTLVAPLLLAALLFAQVLLGAALRNGPFQDEATFIYAGRQYVEALTGGPPVTEEYARYFAGLPYLQPLALGALAMVGGLEAARALSTAMLLAVTLGVFLLTRLLFDERSALFAAAVFAFQAPVLFISRLATYDSGCLLLLTFAAVMAVGAAHSRGGRGLDLAAGAALLVAGAFLVKYSALMFVPVIVALLGAEAWRRAGARRAMVLVATMLAVWAGVAALSFVFLAGSLAQDVRNGVTFSVSVTRISPSDVERLLRERFVELTAGLCLLSAAGALLTARQRPLLAAVLAGGFLLAPLYHAVRGEMVSLQKHVAYGAIFAAPLAGSALARWWGSSGDLGLGIRRVSSGLVICLLAFSGVSGARLLYSEWPDGQSAAEIMRRELTPSSKVLAEEVEIVRLTAYGLLPDKNWVSTEWVGPSYAWPYPASRDGATGRTAMREAIEDGWFDLILFRYGPSNALARELEPVIQGSGRYTEIVRLPYRTRFGEGQYVLWKRVG